MLNPDCRLDGMTQKGAGVAIPASPQVYPTNSRPRYRDGLSAMRQISFYSLCRRWIVVADVWR